jgi:hypothetical protein
MQLLPEGVEVEDVHHRLGLTAAFLLAGSLAALVGAIGVVAEYTLSPFQAAGFFVAVAVMLGFAGGYLLRKYLEVVRD